MYHFAIVALLGLAAYKVVDFLMGLGKADEARLRLFLTLAVGVIFTEILDYSLFSGWKIAIRNTWMGPVWTGLIVGGTSYAWHEALGLVGGFGRHQLDEALEIERRTPRAA